MPAEVKAGRSSTARRLEPRRRARGVGVGREPDDEAEPAERLAVAFEQDRPAAGRHDAPFGQSVDQFGEDSRLPFAKGGLAFVVEDRADRPAGDRLDLAVSVGERPFEPLGQDPADSRLAGGSIADQGDPSGFPSAYRS